METKRVLALSDLASVRYVSAPAVSQDGRTAVYVRRIADAATGEFPPALFAALLEGGEPFRIADHGHTQEAPAFSPDGRFLAFLGQIEGEKQVCLWDIGRREARTLTTLRHGVAEFTWAPDSRSLCFLAPLWPGETDATAFTPMTHAEREEWGWRKENEPVAVEELMYKFNEIKGIVDGSHAQPGIVTIEGALRLLVRDDRPYAGPAFSPDGRTLALFVNPYGHSKAYVQELCVMDIEEGSEPRQLTKENANFCAETVCFTEAGDALLFAAYSQEEGGGTAARVYRLPVSGGEKEDLFPKGEAFYHGVGPLVTGRTAIGALNPPFVRLGAFVYFLSGWDGCANVYRLSLDGERAVEKVTDGKFTVHSFCAPVGDSLVYVRGELTRPGELYAYSMKTGEETRLTNENAWLEGILMPEIQEMRVESIDGKARVHGFVYLPPERKDGEKHPGILNIHGGPTAFYAADFSFEFHYLAAAGFAVVACNPRGSFGYGAAFCAGDVAWGAEAYDDLIAFLDAALCVYRRIDRDRLGVTGGSYGGHMTSRVISSTNRFKAAVNQRTLACLATSYGTGDMGFVSLEKDRPASMLSYLENRAKRSQIAKIDKMKTPMLILHGQADYRCGIEQAEGLFVAMKERNPDVPARLVIFPGESHDITRTGRLRAQSVHLAEMTGWFERFLKKGGSGDAR